MEDLISGPLSDVELKLDAVIKKADPATAQEITEALQVILEALERYQFHELALSFNGGKDCTVVFHLLRIVLERRFANDDSKDFSHLKLVYFQKDDEFDEMKQFVESVKAQYGIRVDVLPSSYKEGLKMMESEGYKAVFMGQRKTDPYGADLDHFTHCTEGWPNIVRINPILHWSYSTIWAFLRGCELEYCKLYDEGYTSLGSVYTTTRNPLLVAGGEGSTTPRPAYELEDGDKFERVGRENMVQST